MDEKTIREIDTACRRCYEVCRQTLTHSVVSVKSMNENHLRLLLDCAGSCVAASEIIRLRPDLFRDECQRCAVACRNFGHCCEGEYFNDGLINECVSECQRCAEICEEIAVSSEAQHAAHR